MPTTRRRRRQEAREPLEASMRAFLLFGTHAAAMRAHEAAKAAAGITGHTGFEGLAQYYLQRLQHADLWMANSEDLVEGVVREHPGRRPWGWWQWDAAEPRQFVGGAGHVVPWSPGHYEWIWRQCFGLPYLADLNPAAPPVFESEPAALRRLGELSREEARRLDPADFEPLEMVVLTGMSRTSSVLGYAPPGAALDDDDPEEPALDDVPIGYHDPETAEDEPCTDEEDDDGGHGP